jgi:alpha-tubulin suppressor-like RCC1 family protein
MEYIRKSFLDEAVRLLAIGAAVCVAGVSVLVASVPAAQGASGVTIEHWGAIGTGHKQYDVRRSPVSLSLPARVAEVSSSNSTQYALLTNGNVYAWGIGTHGELGNGSKKNAFTAAVRVQFPPGVKIAYLPTDVMPYDSAFAVDTTGHVWGWGINAGGELCLGNRSEHNKPVRLPLSRVTTLAGAADHATYDAGGTLYSCGSDTYGELGSGNTPSSNTPVRVHVLDGSSVRTLVASWGDTGALLSNGEYFDWGYDGGGQLGNGTTGTNSGVPVHVTLPGSVTQAAQGGSLENNGQTLVMLANGALYAWGNGHYYQLGDGKRANEPSPEQIFPPPGVTYRTLATGGSTSYAISTAGDVYAWGDSADGQVGDGKTTRARKPVRVETGAGLISSTAADVVVGPGAG